MPSYQMRELTKQENNIFYYYLKGYSAGIKYVPANWVHKNQIVIFEDVIPKAYKEDIKFLKRRKERYTQYWHGFIDGYFHSISCDRPICQQDPFRNRDIYEYIKSLWLYHKIYGATETSGK